MVDGLEDFEFCGTFLDIEACLEAQQFRRQPPKAAAASASSSSSSSRPVMAEVQPIWPRMQKLTFSFGEKKNEKGQSMAKQMELACTDLKQLRPGIQFSCQFFDIPT